MAVPVSKTAVSAAVGLALTGAMATSQAASFAIKSMSITSGSFFMAGVTSSPLPFAVIGPNTNLVGSYINGGVSSPTPDPNTIVGFEFFNFPVNTYTAATSNVSAIPGGAVPTGTLDDVAGTISMDLSSFFVNWSGNDIAQGNASAGAAGGFVGSWCPGCGVYTMSWTALAGGGPAVGFTARWVIRGHATPVPIPAAAWLFASGVVGLVGVARRRWRAA